MKLGTNTIASLKIGSTDISEVRLGSVLVWQNMDADASAFIAAAGITDATQKSAINTLVVDLKSYSLWTKMKAIYPFIGGTASTHKWNLKDPRDLVVAFRLTFNGGWTHASTGVKGNGTNTNAVTYLSPFLELTLNSTHNAVYSRTNSAIAAIDLGCNTVGVPSPRFINHIKWSDNNTYQDQYSSGATRLVYGLGATASTRLFIGNRNANNILNVWRDGTKLATNATANTDAMPNIQIAIGASNESGTAVFPSSREYSFVSIGDGLSDTEAANLTTAVNTYQTTLSRNV